MSAPSFSSFPDFSALPHSGPSNHSLHSPLTPSTPKEERRTKRDTPHRSRNLSDKHKKHKRDKHRSDKSGHRSLDPSDDLTQLHQDERLKAEDDRKRKDSVLFYSDRKGDALNLQYGRLHAGDVPKYRLIGGMLLFGFTNDWLIISKVEERYLVLVMHGRLSTEITWASKSVPVLDDAYVSWYLFFWKTPHESYCCVL